MRVAFFATCLADSFFAESALAATRVLRRLGVDVVVPAGQTCCGQPAFNAGHRAEAAAMAACLPAPTPSCFLPAAARR
jgi:L-lactate dehydrogenase complex protein LldE